MAIAFDAVTTATFNGSGTFTYSHTCTGPRGILLVSATTTTGDPTFTATYNGVSMTEIRHCTAAQSGQACSWFYLLGPATGTHNVVVNSTGGDVVSGAISYTGVDQTSGLDGETVAFDNSDPHEASLTSTADNCWFVTLSAPATVPTGGTGTTTMRGSAYTMTFGDSNSAKTPAGSVTLGWTGNNGSTVTVFIASLAPYVSPIKTIDGLAIASVKTWDGLA